MPRKRLESLSILLVSQNHRSRKLNMKKVGGKNKRNSTSSSLIQFEDITEV